MAVREALAVAGIGIDDIATFDLYSCFRCRCSTSATAWAWPPDDPRGLTLTGGLPFFGGAGNNYSMHGVAETSTKCGSRQGNSVWSAPTAAS